MSSPMMGEGQSDMGTSKRDVQTSLREVVKPLQ